MIKKIMITIGVAILIMGVVGTIIGVIKIKSKGVYQVLGSVCEVVIKTDFAVYKMTHFIKGFTPKPKDKEKLRNKIITYLKEWDDAEKSVRWWRIPTILQQLARLGNSSVPILIDIMIDTKEDKMVRYYAQGTLESFIDFRKEYVDTCTWPKDEYINLHRLVQRIDLGDSIPRLIEIGSDKKRVFENRRYSIELLGMIRDKRVVEPLIRLLDDEDIFAYAIRALGEIGDERAIEPIIRILESRKWSREVWIKELEQKDRTKKSIKEMIDLFGVSKTSYDPCIVALGKIGGKKSIAVLMNLFKRIPTDEAIIEALGAAKAKEAVPMLIEMLEREKDYYRGSIIIETLGNIGTDEAIEILIKRYQQEGGGCYIIALGNSKNRKAIPFIEEVLKGGNKYDAELAVKALKKITGREYKYKR